MTSRTRGMLTAAMALVALAGTMATAAPARAAEVPSGFFGLGGWSYLDNGQAAELSASGLRVFRASLAWDDVERQQGVRNWAHVDALLTRARLNGIDVLFVLNGCTAWACGAADVPPTNEPALSQYRNFVGEAVRRYGSNGSFWGGQPHPRVMWQVGNEVNGGHYFGKNPQPSAYASFLSAVGSTIKTADPAATVVASGLVEKPGDSSGVFLQSFLTALYEQPGFASSFDVAAVHGYAEDPAGTQRVLDTMRRVMLEANDGTRPLWITEMSWATGGPAHAFRVDEATQAAYLRASWDGLLSCRARWNLQKVMWFGYADVDAATVGEMDYWGVHTGLLRRDRSPKPAYAAFLEYLGGSLPAGRADTCGAAGGTALDILDPDSIITGSPRVTKDVTGPTVSFRSNELDARFECSLDGVEAWRPCRSPHPVGSDREGTHWLRVRAIDPQGNVDPSPARVDWMLDLTPPSTTIGDRTPRTTNTSVLSVSFTGRDAVGVAGFECRLDKGAWTPCTSPYRTPRLRAGWHAIEIRTIDTAGHVDPTPLNPTFKIDPAARVSPCETRAYKLKGAKRTRALKLCQYKACQAKARKLTGSKRKRALKRCRAAARKR